MAKRKKSGLGPPYESPPITECVMELRFKDVPRPDFARKASRRLQSFYDHNQTEQLVNFEVAVTQGVVKTRTTDPMPIVKLTSQDQADICTVAMDKIFWGRLAPYVGWDEFAARIARDLDALTRTLAKRVLSRVGLRYVNRIDVPATPGRTGLVCRYEDYLAIKIDLPELLDPTDGFDWRAQKKFRERNLSAMVRSTVMDPVFPQSGAFLLDIDIFRELDEPVVKSDIASVIDEMRVLKNEIFEASITDTARESFQ